VLRDRAPRDEARWLDRRLPQGHICVLGLGALKYGYMSSEDERIVMVIALTLCSSKQSLPDYVPAWRQCSRVVSARQLATPQLSVAGRPGIARGCSLRR
jgi:hypothetical protein